MEIEALYLLLIKFLGVSLVATILWIFTRVNNQANKNTKDINILRQEVKEMKSLLSDWMSNNKGTEAIYNSILQEIKELKEEINKK